MKYIIALLLSVSTTVWADTNPLAVRSVHPGHAIIACTPSARTDGACNTSYKDLYPTEYAKLLGFSEIHEQFVVITSNRTGVNSWILLMEVSK